ncbi:MAG: hypothetical protein IJD72_07640 [Alistipes sp.]|nr:hypothetical protein [Alistipes sp.]
MRRLIYISLASLICGLYGVLNYAGSIALEYEQTYILQQTISSSESSDNDDLRMYNNDMFRASTPRCIVLEEAQTLTTTSSSARYRTSNTSLKIMATALSERRAGHVTKIFEFNRFTSSLRIGYYLYALCRLRI